MQITTDNNDPMYITTLQYSSYAYYNTTIMFLCILQLCNNDPMHSTTDNNDPMHITIVNNDPMHITTVL